MPAIRRHLSFSTNMVFLRVLCLFIGCFVMVTYLRQKSNENVFKADSVGILDNIEEPPVESPKVAESPIDNYLKMRQHFQENVIKKISATKAPTILSDVEKYKHDNPLNPMDLNKSLPKHCVRDVNGYLRKVRQSQQELVDSWHQSSTTDVIKWTSITSLYDPAIVNFALFFNFVSDSENKYFMDFNKRDTNCNVVSFGVGMDYSGEVTLYNRYPQCKFTAVDPLTYVNKEMVEYVPGARFFEAAIGANDGKHVASIRNENKQYKTKIAEHVGITSFLQKINGNTMIDLLLVDIEGGEFGVLPKLIEDKHLLPTICQINFELHYPPKDYNYTNAEVFDGLKTFFADGTYTIFNMEIWHRFHRIYAVNTANPECIKKFFC